jgi:hypothetical protein
MRFEFVWVGVHHNLPVSTPKRLWNGSAWNTGNLVADTKLRKVAKLRLIESIAL